MQPLLKDAADTIPPTANGHGVDCSRQQVGASEETAVVLVNSDHLTCAKPADSGLTSQERSESNAASDTQQSPPPTDKGEEEAPNQNGAAKDKQKEPVSAGCSSRQLFPPGRIIHMVALPPPPDPNPGEGTSSDEIIGIYETPRDLYGKIRLAPNMVKEHYMPSYISTMESLLEQLQKDDGTSSVCVCTASNELWIVVENSVVINPILSHHLIFLSRLFSSLIDDRVTWTLPVRTLGPYRPPYAGMHAELASPSLSASRPHATREHLQASMKQFPFRCNPTASQALARIDMAASGGGGAAALRGLVVVLAVVSVWGAVAAIHIKETCSLTTHPDICEKAMNKLVGPDGAPAEAPAPATSAWDRLAHAACMHSRYNRIIMCCNFGVLLFYRPAGRR